MRAIEGIKDTITINDTEYKLKCIYVLARKVPNSDIPGLQLELFIWRKDKNIWKNLEWKDFKNTYTAEKICDYVKNKINGQRTFCWENES